ncbi:hypothetical protein ABZ614_41230 [Streptomyces sp. NPDC013178]|uniref:hypothetical protein n=1 Tax=Streptomyces sp. NPDC013178 TaxID=3155118 RepID=UPI0033F8AF5D
MREDWSRLPEHIAVSVWGCLQLFGYREPKAYANGEADETTAAYADPELEEARGPARSSRAANRAPGAEEGVGCRTTRI